MIYATDSSLNSVVVKGDLQGGDGMNSGSISAKRELNSVSIGGSILGKIGVGSGAIYAGNDISSISVKGSVSSGTGLFSGSIQSGDDLGSLNVGGDVAGTAAANVEIIGQNSIGAVTVKGRMDFTQVLAGYQASSSNSTPIHFSSNASIGTVKIGGDLLASSIVAGVTAGTDQLFGTSDDAFLTMAPFTTSRIASVIVGGAVEGYPVGGNHFGIVARDIGYVKIGSVVESRLSTAVDDPIEVNSNTTNDFTIREVTASTTPLPPGPIII